MPRKAFLQITPASTNPKFTDEEPSNTIFRTCGRDDQQGSFAGPWIAEHYKGKNVAIVHDKSQYGQGLADLTKAAMNAAGQTEAMYEAITAGEQDYTALVTKMKENKIDVIYFGGYHPEAALIVKQARCRRLPRL
jgi:branched-chain amino acid transport system substrate-binding protein